MMTGFLIAIMVAEMLLLAFKNFEAYREVKMSRMAVSMFHL